MKDVSIQMTKIVPYLKKSDLWTIMQDNLTPDQKHVCLAELASRGTDRYERAVRKALDTGPLMTPEELESAANKILFERYPNSRVDGPYLWHVVQREYNRASA